MRTRVISLILFAMHFTFASIAYGAENRDGNWWNGLTVGQKLAYATGFLDGQTYAQWIIIGAELQGMADPKSGKFDAGRARTAKEVGQYASNAFKQDFSNVTNGQLAAGLDKIYADYRNLRIDVTNAMIVVVRSIGGMSDDDIEKFLEKKRQSAFE